MFACPEEIFLMLTLLKISFYAVEGIYELRESIVVSGSGLDILGFFLLLQSVLIYRPYLFSVFVIRVDESLPFKQSIHSIDAGISFSTDFLIISQMLILTLIIRNCQEVHQ